MGVWVGNIKDLFLYKFLFFIELEKDFLGFR